MSLKEKRGSSAPPYPTPAEIEATFTKVETPEELERLQELFAKDFHGVVTGHDHSFVGEHHGHGTWFEQLSSILDVLEHENTFKLDIVRVIGGENSPWACMEAKATAKTKGGKDYNNEFVWVMHFNEEGKIDKARAYYDSAHMESLAEEMKA